MSDFRQTFLADSISYLNALEPEVAKNYSENLRREIFRRIHTVKGGAQTFGLARAVSIAAELEDMLSTGASTFDRKLLADGIRYLIDALRNGERSRAGDSAVLEKLRSGASRQSSSVRIWLTRISRADFEAFSSAERRAFVASSSGEDGAVIFCVETAFEAADFAEGFRRLHEILSENGEILASLPGGKNVPAGKIGFRIFLAAAGPANDLRSALAAFDAAIVNCNCSDHDALDSLRQMFAQIAVHGESVARKAGKEIVLTIVSNAVMPLESRLQQNFFEILLHLARNAVDHGIERTGAIEINLFIESEGAHLSVADDGRGIDLGKVRARAVAKNLISAEDVLTEDETLRLIFAPELSTAEKLTEISGRGVGLDAVKETVEKMNGKISVRNRKSKGAIFEIFVPTKKI